MSDITSDDENEKNAGNGISSDEATNTDKTDEAAPIVSAEEEIEAALADSSAKKKQKLARKKKIKYASIGLALLLVAYVVYWGIKPYKGSSAYGVCKVFLELTLRYPKTLRVSTVEELKSSVRIWYTQTDSFGEYRLEPIQCYFKKDERYGFALERVTIRRREVDKALVTDFNNTLPAVFANMPDLTIPAPLTDSLKDLQIETFRFRKPIF